MRTKTVTQAFAQALRNVRKRHSTVAFHSLIEHSAWERFKSACAKIDTRDPLFNVEGPAYAEFLLLDEVLLFSKATGGEP